MASFADKVKVLIDVDSTGAVSGLTKFKQSFSEAEGATGKFKVASSAAFDAIKANAVEFGVAAAAAIGTFAVKAIGQFQDLALEVDKFANSTGLASEEASRYVEVAGDMGIESAAVEKAINKMNVEIGKGSKAFEELGIEVVRTEDGLLNTNETFIKAIGALSGVKDPADRARIATELFGKGWRDMSELIVGGEGKLRQALGAVSDAKIIDQKEIDKAKELRAVQDRLKDAFEDFALTVGQVLLPALVKFLEVSSKIAEGLSFVGKGARIALDALNPFDSVMSGVARVSDSSASAWERGYGAIQTLGSALPGVNVALDALGGWLFGSDDKTKKLSASQEILESTFGKVTVAAGKQRYAGLELANAVRELDDDTNGLIDTFDKLLGQFDREETISNLRSRLEDYRKTVIDVFENQTPKSTAAANEAMKALVREIAGVAKEAQLTSQEQVKIVALLEKGQFDRAVEETIRALGTIPRSVAVEIVGRVSGIQIPSGQTPSETIGVPPRLRSTAGIQPTSSLTNVTVNVAGNVTTESDLVESVRKGLVDAQRSGKQLVVTGF